MLGLRVAAQGRSAPRGALTVGRLSSSSAIAAHYFFAIASLQTKQAREPQQAQPAPVHSVIAVGSSSGLPAIRICVLGYGKGRCSGHCQHYDGSQNQLSHVNLLVHF